MLAARAALLVVFRAAGFADGFADEFLALAMCAPVPCEGVALAGKPGAGMRCGTWVTIPASVCPLVTIAAYCMRKRICKSKMHEAVHACASAPAQHRCHNALVVSQFEIGCS